MAAELQYRGITIGHSIGYPHFTQTAEQAPRKLGIVPRLPQQQVSASTAAKICKPCASSTLEMHLLSRTAVWRRVADWQAMPNATLVFDVLEWTFGVLFMATCLNDILLRKLCPWASSFHTSRCW